MDVPKETPVRLSQRGYQVVTDGMGNRWHLHGDRIAQPNFGGHCLFCEAGVADARS